MSARPGDSSACRRSIATFLTEVTRQGLGDPALVRKPYPVLEDASFFRTSRTLAELGRAFLKFGQALRKDVECRRLAK